MIEPKKRRTISTLSILKPACSIHREEEKIALSKTSYPILDRSHYVAADGLRCGAYVLSDAPTGKPELILLASGSKDARPQV